MAWYGSDDDFQAFINEYGLTFPQVSDPDGEVFARFGVASQPAVVVIDAAGTATLLPGATDADELTAVLTELGA
ncbi:MAG: Redoxin [Actinomycetota bacterium]